MALGHGRLVGGVRVGRLLLGFLVGADPRQRGAGGGGSAALLWGHLLRGCRSGPCRRVHVDGNFLLHDLLHNLLHHLGAHDGLGQLARRVRAGVGRGALGSRVRLAVVGAVELHHELGLRGVTGVDLVAVLVPERRQVQAEACGGEAAERDVEARGAVATVAVGLDDVDVAALEDAAGELGEHLVGTHLHEGADAGVVHGLHLLHEAHRVGDLLGEGLAHRLGRLAVGRGGGVAVDGDGRLVEGDAVEELAEGLARVGHDLAVEGRGHVEALGGHLRVEEALLGIGDGLGAARDDYLVRSVVVGDHHVELPLGELGLHLFAGGHDGGHRAGGGAGGLGHQLAALARHRDEVGVAEHACSAQGGDLTVGVTAHGGGGEAHAVEQVERGEAGHADGGLGPLGAGELGGLRLGGGLVERLHGEDHAVELLAVEVDVGREVPRGECAGVADGRARAHVEVLAALSGEEEAHVALVLAEAHGGAVGRGGGLALGSEVGGLVELRGELGLVGGDHCDAGRSRGVEGLLGALREVVQHARKHAVLGHGAGVGGHALGVGAGDQHELSVRHAVTAGLVGGGARVFLHRDVEVGAAEAKRAHRGATRVVGATDPRLRTSVEVEGARGQVDERVGLVDLHRGRKGAVVQGHDGLEQAGSARRSLGVADLRLHGAEGTPLPVGGLHVAEGHLESAELGSVASLGAGAVGLHELDRLGTVASTLVGTTDGLGLSLGDRSVDALGAAVRRGADGLDDGVDVVSVALCIGETLEGDHSETLAEHGAVGLVGEGTAVAGGGQCRRLAEAHVHEDVVHGVDTAGDDDVGLTEVELVDGHGERREGAGTGSVGHAVGAAEVEAVGDAAGHHVAEHAGEGGLDPRGVLSSDALDGLLDLVLGQTCLTQAAAPDGVLQAGDHGAEQLLGAGDAEDAAHALAADGLELVLEGVLEHLLGHDEGEQL